MIRAALCVAAMDAGDRDEQCRAPTEIGQNSTRSRMSLIPKRTKRTSEGSGMLLGSVQVQACVASVGCIVVVATEFIVYVMCGICAIMRNMIIWSYDHIREGTRHVNHQMRGRLTVGKTFGIRGAECRTHSHIDHGSTMADQGRPCSTTVDHGQAFESVWR